MRSRFVRLVLGLIALSAFAGSAFFVVNFEKQIADSRTDSRAFDLHALEARDLIANLRSAQQGYVASGQSRDAWQKKADALREQTTAKAMALRAEAVGMAAKLSIDNASQALDDFKSVDARVREYLSGGQDLMAADVVYTEGGASLATAQKELEDARVAEQQTLDASESATRRQEGLAAAGAGLVGVLVIAVLALTGAAPRSEAMVFSAGEETAANRSDLTLHLRTDAHANRQVRGDASLLKAAAELCTEFGRIHDQEQLDALLGRAADLLDATGLVVWLGNTTGADLTPVLAHGYSPQALSRMPAMPRSANNAAAAAYRSSQLQIVMSKPGVSTGAVVAPLLSPEGCIGALSIEIKGGGETSDAIQAMSGIVAAQLAGVLGGTAVDNSQSEARTAAQG